MRILHIITRLLLDGGMRMLALALLSAPAAPNPSRLATEA